MGKVIKLLFPALGVLVAGFFIIFSLFVYRISYPAQLPATVNPSHHLLPFLDLSTTTSKGDEIHGWWIPGLKGAPGIVLAPGYGMNRSDALSLAVGLHRLGFNLYIYGQRGSEGPDRRASTLGIYEVEDMLAAVRLLRDRPEVYRERIGIWGVDIGALAALQATAIFPEIQAIAADSAFQSPYDFLSCKIEEEFGLNNRFFHFGCRQVFRIFHIPGSLAAGSDLPLRELSERSILFIKGDNRKSLGSLTTRLYETVFPRKELISLKAARVHSMSGEDLRNYDRQVVNFFQLHLR